MPQIKTSQYTMLTKSKKKNEFIKQLSYNIQENLLVSLIVSSTKGDVLIS